MKPFIVLWKSTSTLCETFNEHFGVSPAPLYLPGDTHVEKFHQRQKINETDFIPRLIYCSAMAKGGLIPQQNRC